jgi:hypothetical protein
MINDIAIEKKLWNDIKVFVSQFNNVGWAAKPSILLGWVDDHVFYFYRLIAKNRSHNTLRTSHKVGLLFHFDFYNRFLSALK